MGPLKPGMGPLGPKIGSRRHGINPQEHINCLLLFDVGSERLQYSIVQIPNGPSELEGGGLKFHPFTPSGCVTGLVYAER